MMYLIVYPNGDNSKVAVVEAQWFDNDDYDKIVYYPYDERSTARRHAQILCDAFGLEYQE